MPVLGTGSLVMGKSMGYIELHSMNEWPLTELQSWMQR